MASIVRSANNAGSGVFDLLNQSAHAVGQSLTLLTRGVDTLDVKLEALHHDVVIHAKLSKSEAVDNAVIEAATNRADRMEEAHRRNKLSAPFNREAIFLAAVQEFKQLLTA